MITTDEPVAESLIQATAEPKVRSWRTASPGVYLPLVLSIAVVWLLLPFVAARSRLLDEMSGHIFWHIMEFHLGMKGEHCDVIVFGDSTGATGIDPLVVQSHTGYKTCVLSLPYMALASTGNRVLDNYLDRSAAPKLIIFAEHAAHLRPPTYDEDWGIIDGWLLVDRLLSPGKAARFYLMHPKDSLVFAEHWWQQVFTLNPGLLFDPLRRSYLNDAAILSKYNGYYPLATGADPSKVCSIQAASPSFDRGYLDELRRRYSVQGTKVLLYASPVRSCDRNVAAYERIANTIGIAPPEVFPAQAFSDAWHLNSAGARRNSAVVSHLIASDLDRGSSGSGNTQNWK